MRTYDSLRIRVARLDKFHQRRDPYGTLKWYCRQICTPSWALRNCINSVVSRRTMLRHEEEERAARHEAYSTSFGGTGARLDSGRREDNRRWESRSGRAIVGARSRVGWAGDEESMQTYVVALERQGLLWQQLRGRLTSEVRLNPPSARGKARHLVRWRVTFVPIRRLSRVRAFATPNFLGPSRSRQPPRTQP